MLLNVIKNVLKERKELFKHTLQIIKEQVLKLKWNEKKSI